MRSAAVLSLFCACSCLPAATELGSAPRAIRGGYADDQLPAVVGIFDNATGAQCTGTLIAPKLVLTAQHCVAFVPVPLDCQTTRFGPPGPPGNYFVTTRGMFSFNPNDYHEVAEVVIPPGDNYVCGHDVALIVLDRAVAASEATPIEPRLDPAPAIGELYSAIGFGATSSAATESGTRRRRDALSVECIAGGCGDSYVRDSEWRGEHGICVGDSGGPAIDSAGRVVGVASRGVYDCSAPVYALLPAYRDWIVAELARAGGGAIDAGARDAMLEDAAILEDATAPEDDASAPADAAAAFEDASSAGADAGVTRDAAANQTGTDGGGCVCVQTARDDRASSAIVLAAAILLCAARRMRYNARRCAPNAFEPTASR